MDRRQLKYLITIVEKGTMIEASKFLHIAQPSLSIAIKKLESNVGFEIFYRDKRKLKLTEQGELLYQEAKHFMNHFDYLTKEVERIKLKGPLHISIGIIESAKYWIPKIVSKYIESHPDITFKVSEVLGHHEVKTALENYYVHFAITNQLISDEFIQSVEIYNEKLVVLLPKKHHLTSYKQIHIEDLKDEAFIICEEGYQTREDTLRAFREKGMVPHIKYEMQRLETACTFVEEGLGITIIPENYVIYKTKRNFVIKELSDDNISRSVYIAYVSGRRLPPIVMELIELIKEFFRER